LSHHHGGREVGHSAVMRVVASPRRAGGRVVRRVDDDPAEDPGQAGQVRDAGSRPAPILEARDRGLGDRAQRLQPPLGQAARSAGLEERATDPPEVVVDVSGSVAWDRHRPIQLGPTSRGINCPLWGIPIANAWRYGGVSGARDRGIQVPPAGRLAMPQRASPGNGAAVAAHARRGNGRRRPDTALAADAPTRHWPLTPDAASAPRAELIGRAKARGPTIANGS